MNSQQQDGTVSKNWGFAGYTDVDGELELGRLNVDCTVL